MFWLLFPINAGIAAIFAWFFFSGVAAGTIQSTNLIVWFLIFAVLCGDLLGALFLYIRGLTVAALAVLAGFAMPALFATLLMFGVISF